MDARLQGVAADWARSKLETGHFEGTGRLQRINTRERDLAEAVASCTQLVTAVGFQRNALPHITVDSEAVTDMAHDPHSGVIIPGKLYGYGIAFPEEIIDPEYRHRESSVGLLKFMKYVRRVLPAQSLCNM